MQKVALYGIIATVVVAASVGIAFAAMSSMNDVAKPEHDVTNQQQSSDNKVRVIKHAMGETEITDTPERIVALEWSASESLLTMGIQPVAVADLEGMKKYLKPKGLSPGIVDVGQIFEPNLEAITQLEPDLIFAEKLSASELYEELSSIAPTIIYDNSPPLDGNPTHLESLEQNTILFADAVNRHDEGVTIVERLHAKYEEAAKKIQTAGLKGEKFVVGAADPAYESTPPNLRFFDNTFFMSQMLSRIGLENTISEEYGLANWGMKQVGLEGLATVDGSNVHFFYIHADGQDLFETEWKDNPVWANLQIEKNGNRHPLGPLYVYGGPKEMSEMIDKVVYALTDGSNNSNSTRTIGHAMGETEIAGTPQRIIPLDTVAVEVVLALGGQTVGMGSLEDHKIWTPEISTKWPDVVSVGETWEPNLEVMAQLEPDLIIGMQAAHSGMYDDLSSIAPTILLDNWPPEGGPTMLEAVEQNTMTIADALNRHEEGAAFLEGFHAKIDENAAKLEAAGLDGARFILADTRTFEGAPEMRLYVPNSQNSEILERMGLENVVPPPEEFQRFGSIDISLEALTTLDGPNVHFIYVSSPFPGSTDPLTDPAYWKDNPVWTKLQFVQEGNVYRLDPVNFFRGPLELEKLADRSVDALTGR